MQAKDITEADFLNAVAGAQVLSGRAANRWEVGLLLRGQPLAAGGDAAARAEEGMPQKLVLAKAAKLIKKGSLQGCACGCRGDFEVVR